MPVCLCPFLCTPCILLAHVHPTSIGWPQPLPSYLYAPLLQPSLLFTSWHSAITTALGLPSLTWSGNCLLHPQHFAGDICIVCVPHTFPHPPPCPLALPWTLNPFPVYLRIQCPRCMQSFETCCQYSACHLQITSSPLVCAGAFHHLPQQWWPRAFPHQQRRAGPQQPD